MFLNSTNRDKVKRRDAVDDVASAWDRQSFRAYVGIDDERGHGGDDGRLAD